MRGKIPFRFVCPNNNNNQNSPEEALLSPPHLLRQVQVQGALDNRSEDQSEPEEEDMEQQEEVEAEAEEDELELDQPPSTGLENSLSIRKLPVASSWPPSPSASSHARGPPLSRVNGPEAREAPAFRPQPDLRALFTTWSPPAHQPAQQQGGSQRN